MAFTTVGSRFPVPRPDELPGPYLAHLDLGKKKVHDHAGSLDLGSTMRPGFASTEPLGGPSQLPRAQGPPIGTYDPKDTIADAPQWFARDIPRVRQPFASSGPRIAPLGPAGAGPDPGTYKLPSAFKKKQRPATASVDGSALPPPRENTVNKRPYKRATSAPSIPGRESHGYENQKGTLGMVKRPAPHPVRTTPARPSLALTSKGSRAAGFGIGSRDKNNPDARRVPSTATSPEPGAYELKKFGEPQFPRGTYPITQTRGTRGQKIRPATAAPGPGAYGYGDVHGTLAEKPGDVQFFKSRTDRFRQHLRRGAAPDPGTYTPKKPAVRTTDLGKGSARPIGPKAKQEPGPGEYSLDLPPPLKNRVPFASTENRFPATRPPISDAPRPPALTEADKLTAEKEPPPPPLIPDPVLPRKNAYDMHGNPLPDWQFRSQLPLDTTLRQHLRHDATKDAFGAHTLKGVGDVTPDVAYCGPGFGCGEAQRPGDRTRAQAPPPGTYTLKRPRPEENVQPFASTESRVDLQVKWAVKKGLSLPPPGTYKVDKAASEWPAASFNTRYREEWREDKTMRVLEPLAAPGWEPETVLDYAATRAFANMDAPVARVHMDPA